MSAIWWFRSRNKLSREFSRSLWGSGFFCLLVFGKEEQIVCFCVECPSATRTWQWTFHLNHRKYPALFTARLEVLTGEEGVRCWVKIAAATSSLPRSRTATVPNTSTQENHSHEMKWLLWANNCSSTWFCPRAHNSSWDIHRNCNMLSLRMDEIDSTPTMSLQVLTIAKEMWCYTVDILQWNASSSSSTHRPRFTIHNSRFTIHNAQANGRDY